MASKRTAEPRERASILATASNGRVSMSPRILIYGAEKVGKSTFAANAPNTVYLSLDHGTADIAVNGRVSVQSTDDVRDLLAELEAGGHGFKTLVIDPIGFLDDLILRDLLDQQPNASAANWGGGFGALKAAVNRVWLEIKESLERLWRRGMAIVIVAHSAIRKVNDPLKGEFSQHYPDLRERPAELFLRWVDAIVYAHADTVQRENGSIDATGDRILQARWTPRAVAGNRWHLPEEMPLSWAALMRARREGRATVDRVEAALSAATERGVPTLAVIEAREAFVRGADPETVIAMVAPQNDET